MIQLLDYRFQLRQFQLDHHRVIPLDRQSQPMLMKFKRFKRSLIKSLKYSSLLDHDIETVVQALFGGKIYCISTTIKLELNSINGTNEPGTNLTKLKSIYLIS